MPEIFAEILFHFETFSAERFFVTEEKKKRGRKPIINAYVMEKIIQYSEEGKTEEQIAYLIGVSRKSIVVWLQKFKELGITVREARLKADTPVGATLYEMALGYERELYRTKSVDPETGKETEEVKKEFVPPNRMAAERWLKNRQPDEWNKKQSSKDENDQDKTRVQIIIPKKGR